MNAKFWFTKLTGNGSPLATFLAVSSFIPSKRNKDISANNYSKAWILIIVS